MKKLFIILPAVILISACVSKTNVTNRPPTDYKNNRPAITDTYYGVDSGAADESGDFTGESRYGSKSAYGDAVVTVGSKKFSIGRAAGEKEMRVFQDSLDKAYRAARNTYNPAGFTYTMSPAGAINPLSDMEVNCVLSQDSADDVGQKTCDLFFKSLKSYFEASTNASL